ncbi:MAG: carbohydrate porin [Gemmatimonadota bacterium]|nr:carbohydrate porin [Gemmatimonadota bacterium]
MSLVALVNAVGLPLAGQTVDSTAHPETGSSTWAAAVLGTQLNVIGQRLGRFRSAYSGPNSLDATGDAQVSHTYGVYLGARLGTHLSGFLDVEMVRGAGISRVVGLAGPTNGDVIRQGTADLGTGPYVARAYLRYLIPIRRTKFDTVERAPDQMPGPVPARRVEIIAGKLAASDVFDVNRYANSTRSQFMDWGLFQNTAWDFAADTRGYTNGVAVAWVTPRWAIRAGSFQMPTQANGNKFDPNLQLARGDNVELTVTPVEHGPTVRLLGFVNHARMGRYADALAATRSVEAPPSIVADDRPGRVKYGFGLNAEQPMADAGETGGFLRLGWNDGKTESFAFAEVERHASGGVQLSGAHWRRASDRVAVALLVSGLSSVHRAYLAAGGSGFLLGDGALDYGSEQIVESYYRAQLGPHLQVSPDIQFIRNPGYNRARGPATVLSLRVNLRY